jgi:hypothetical protein
MNRGLVSARCALWLVITPVLAGCSTSHAGTPSAQMPTWAAPAGDDQVEARSAGQPPAFPEHVDRFAPKREWRETTRVFENTDDWSTLYDFPATMNGCGMQRFYVRWRAAAPEAMIEATLVSVPDVIVMVDSGVGSVGWMAGWGCGQPAFRLRSLPGDGNLIDVVVEVQQWESAV